MATLEELAAANDALSQEEATSAAAQRQTALLNQQVAALRTQLSQLQGLLDEARKKDEEAQIQLQTLGSERNTALARVASEERRQANCRGRDYLNGELKESGRGEVRSGDIHAK